MKSYSDQIDDRYYSILEEEFDLASELQRLRDAKKYALADTLRVFMAALTALPPRWSEAIAFGTELADIAYDGSEREFEPFRNALIRALSLLMFWAHQRSLHDFRFLGCSTVRCKVALASDGMVGQLWTNDGQLRRRRER